ncbi:MAG TPA: glycosyltransferase family 2 protein, partial [Gammaproteobacteria bacterium]|nr:glycosyltransferase family 2 protein [Gammaproteobacteria bacterium]
MTSAPAPAKPRLSVVIPFNNEQGNVRPLLEELRSTLGPVTDGGSAARVANSLRQDRYELVLVDDGSTDATAEEIRRAGREGIPLRLLAHADCRGQSTAIYNGIRAARGDLVVLLDGDLQNDPRDIDVLLARYGADERPQSLGLLVGHRRERRDSRLRRLSSRVANSVRGAVLRDRTPDTGCGLKVLRRSVFLELPYFDHMHRFLPALVQRAGYRVVSVPVRHRP